MKRIAVGCVMGALLLTGCARSKTQEAGQSGEPIKEHPMSGEIMGLDPGGHVATIRHGEIKGFMGAMTMGYPVKDAAEFDKLSVGEHITATVYENSSNLWIGNIEKDNAASKQP